MSKVFVIGDCHFGHRGIINHRPQFETPEENDDVIFNNILSKVGKRDTLWLMGDCFTTFESLWMLREIKNRAGFVHLIIGNHETDSGRFKEVLMPAIKEGLYDSFHGLVKYKKQFWLSHAPIHNQELYGRINIHGHVHKNTIDDIRYVNVSADNTNFYPVNIQDIASGWFASKGV